MAAGHNQAQTRPTDIPHWTVQRYCLGQGTWLCQWCPAVPGSDWWCPVVPAIASSGQWSSHGDDWQCLVMPGFTQQFYPADGAWQWPVVPSRNRWCPVVPIGASHPPPAAPVGVRGVRRCPPATVPVPVRGRSHVRGRGWAGAGAGPAAPRGADWPLTGPAPLT